MAIKLHRCPVMWPASDMHPCHRVQRALDEAGIAYEIVKVSWPRKSKRLEVIAGTGGKHVPAIEFEDGSWYRAESAQMADTIRAGCLGHSR